MDVTRVISLRRKERSLWTPPNDSRWSNWEQLGQNIHVRSFSGRKQNKIEQKRDSNY